MTITITLDDDAALVLSDLIESERLEQENPALEAAEVFSLWQLGNELESNLKATFAPDYAESLETAKASLRDRCGPKISPH